MTVQRHFAVETPPERLPGEPDRTRVSGPTLYARLVLHALATAVIGALTTPLWPVFLVSVLVWGWPPTAPAPAQIARYLRLTVTAAPPAPGLPAGVRAWILVSVLKRAFTAPVFGLAWQLDELLYGRALDDTPVVAPLFEVSAARSGSTQLARYLEEDPRLVAPSFLQTSFPYLWLWRLAPATVGRFVTAEQVRDAITSRLPPEFLQRHEGDPFRTDTFEASLFMMHLNHLAPSLGPDVMIEDFSFAVIAPHNRALWERTFVDLLDRVGRKALRFAGPQPDGSHRRLFVKGHFLGACDALAARFPDARFLAMARDPVARLQSAVNYIRANPIETSLGAPPWGWLGAALAENEASYCEVEQAWFTRPDGPRRCVVRFADYVRDLEGTMRAVYRACFDEDAPPPTVPKTHPPRERTNYLLNRPLNLLGVDEAALEARVRAYRAWSGA